VRLLDDFSVVGALVALLLLVGWVPLIDEGGWSTYCTLFVPLDLNN
jgi:hypothetical protein